MDKKQSSSYISGGGEGIETLVFFAAVIVSENFLGARSGDRTACGGGASGGFCWPTSRIYPLFCSVYAHILWAFIYLLEIYGIYIVARD